MKLVALFRSPLDPEAFDKAYFETHIPLIEEVPGLERVVVTRFTRTIMGDDFHLMAEMHFSDKEALKAAIGSPEMEAAGENLRGFAKGLVTLMFAEEI